MANLGQQVRMSQVQVHEAQAMISELTGRIEAVRAKARVGNPSAGLIMGLDDVSAAFSRDFDEMRSKAGRESLVDVFSKHKADSMRQERIKMVKSQTLERYIEKDRTWVDSLQNQAATQMVLINKLQTDTRQRVVLYDALSKSLKTAQQQDVAHRINEIGVKTDQEAQSAMAGIGAATNQRMAEMMERRMRITWSLPARCLRTGPEPMNALPAGSRRSSANTMPTHMGVR